MSRRRAVVRSDDEDGSSRNSLRAGSRPSRPSEVPLQTVPDLENVVKLDTQHYEKIRLILARENRQMADQLSKAIGLVSDAAVPIEELNNMPEREDMVANLEQIVKNLIDALQHNSDVENAIRQTIDSGISADQPINLHEKYAECLKSLDNAYATKTPREKYDNATEYQDFKRRVWDVNHANVPAPRSWFDAASAEDDDDIVVGQEIQSLKCPLTLRLLEEPVRNSLCPHVYSKAAIFEIILVSGGSVPCPVAGCSARVTRAQLREDKIMARKVREEQARDADASRVVEDVDVVEDLEETEDIKLE